MQRSQRDPNDPTITLEGAERFLTLLAHLFSFVPTLCLRQPGLLGKRWATGVRSLGVFAPCVLMAHDNDPLTPCGLSAPFWLLVAHRIAGLIRWRRVREFHTQYDGVPLRFFLWLFRGNEDAYKRFEPLMVIAVGMACMSFSTGLGIYLCLGGVGMVLTHAQCHMKFRAKATAINDARIEQEWAFRIYQEQQRR